jgi:hypothetical protein
VEELDSAAFVLGEHLPEYPSLDEWIEVAKRFDAESHIEVITDWEDAALYYGRFLAEGDPAPTRGQISHDLGISEDAAKRVRSGLRDAGLILGAPNRTGKWGPTTSPSWPGGCARCPLTPSSPGTPRRPACAPSTATT